MTALGECSPGNGASTGERRGFFSDPRRERGSSPAARLMWVGNARGLASQAGFFSRLTRLTTLTDD